MLPTREENPDGLHQHYHITKADGSPYDPSAIYFVLRLDKYARDPAHAEACRKAALCYADNAPPHLRMLAADLRRYVEPAMNPQ
jgi:hypothetical protein